MTQYQEKYNKLKAMSSQMQLHLRKQREVDWILEEMTRAINRLDYDGGVLDPSAMSAQQAKHEEKDDMLHVLAHRQTWSEASSTIFELISKRQNEYQCTQELQHALQDRECLRSWMY